MKIDDSIRRYSIISEQVNEAELNVILAELARTQNVRGSVVEFGCYKGTTSLYIRRTMNNLGMSKEFHVYDSFEGLPKKTNEDVSPLGEQFVRGELRASKKDFIKEFKKSGLTLPVIHKSWFSELTEADVPSEVSFAFLDGDYYESIKDSLRLLEGRLSSGSTIVVDDYVNEALPGAAQAVDEWIASRRLSARSIASLAVIRL